MCCAIAALMIAVVAAWRSLAKGALAWRPSARWAAVVAAGALVAAGEVGGLCGDGAGPPFSRRGSPSDAGAAHLWHTCGTFAALTAEFDLATPSEIV